MGVTHSIPSDLKEVIFLHYEGLPPPPPRSPREVDLDDDEAVRRTLLDMVKQPDPDDDWNLFYCMDLNYPLLKRLANLTYAQVDYIVKVYLASEHFPQYERGDVEFDEMENRNEIREYGYMVIDEMMKKGASPNHFYKWLHTQEAIEFIDGNATVFPNGRHLIVRDEMIANLQPYVDFAEFEEDEVEEYALESGVAKPYKGYWLIDRKVNGVDLPVNLNYEDIPPFGEHAYLPPRTLRWIIDCSDEFICLTDKNHILMTIHQHTTLKIVDNIGRYAKNEFRIPTVVFEDSSGTFSRWVDLRVNELEYWELLMENEDLWHMEMPGMMAYDLGVPRFGANFDFQIMRLEIRGIPNHPGMTYTDITTKYIAPTIAYLSPCCTVLDVFTEWEQASEVNFDIVPDMKNFSGKIVFAITQTGMDFISFSRTEWKRYCFTDMPGFIELEGETFHLLYPGRANHCEKCRAVGKLSHMTGMCAGVERTLSGRDEE